MKLIIENEEEAKEYMKELKDYLIAELMFYQLTKQPEPVRIHLYKMLMQEIKDDTEQY